jgi:hypothetical protein
MQTSRAYYDIVMKLLVPEAKPKVLNALPF